MAKGMYVGVDNKARKAKKLYVGVDNKARKVKKMYIGDSTGKARLAYSAGLGVGIYLASEFKTWLYNYRKTTNEFESYIELETASKYMQNIFQVGDYVYRLEKTQVTSTNQVYQWKRMHKNDSAFSTLFQVSSGDYDVFVTYNEDDKLFTFSRFSNAYACLNRTYESTYVSYAQSNGDTTSLTWTGLFTFTADENCYLWTAPLYCSTDGFVCPIQTHQYSGSYAYTYNRFHTKIPYKTWTIVTNTNGGGCRIEDFRSFNNFYIGVSSTTGGFLYRSAKGDVNNSLITSTQVTLPVYGATNDKLLWHGVVGGYYYIVAYSVASNVLYAMRSSDAINFTLMSTLGMGAISTTYYAYLGNDGDFRYFGISCLNIATGYLLRVSVDFTKIELIKQVSYSFGYTQRSGVNYYGGAFS